MVHDHKHRIRQYLIAELQFTHGLKFTHIQYRELIILEYMEKSKRLLYEC